MEWQEINCLIEALEALIRSYQSQLSDPNIDEADLDNELSYAKILLSKYKEKRDEIAAC
ncbi:Uncharacterised protein [BD1-7 clade bacterium]|uniref:Uncharacterized protein n=1 Tax=BD1-7 clade bacterium TaxID=2029982 RepID=A0A5S9P679_9GAMM|nr:Uncharacterised protein [BD1-7 clade bacterium]